MRTKLLKTCAVGVALSVNGCSSSDPLPVDGGFVSGGTSSATGGSQATGGGGSGNSSNSTGGAATGGTGNAASGGAQSGGKASGGGPANGGAATGGKAPAGGSVTGGAATGGKAPAGGSVTGGAATGGKSTGGSATGGASAGGKAAAGGSMNGGSANGGAPLGGSANGGAATGGKSSTGGSANGGTDIGGAATGGATTGGKATGGVATGGVATGGKATGGVATGGAPAGGASTGCGSTCTEANRTLSANGTGKHCNYTYEYWKDSGSGSLTLTPDGFSVNWSGINNLLGRKGIRPGSANLIVNYEADYQPNGNSYLCVYGWTRNPLVEYYIVDSWGSWRPPGSSSLGTVTSDGGTYDIYKTQRVQQPSIDGTQTFYQYWSVRTAKRTSGTITVGNHFSAWAAKGMNMGSFYEVSMTVEGYQSSGTADVCVSIK